MDPKILDHLKKSDPVLIPIIENSPPPVLHSDRKVYDDLLRSIVSQQLSVKAAETIFGRFLDLFGGKTPEPADLKEVEIPILRGLGFSNAKAAYAKNVAEFFHQNEEGDWHNASDEAIIQQLTAIKGVGKWTVEMILMFSLNRPDVLPVDDLGIQQIMQKLYGLSQNPKELKSQMVATAEPWRPYRTFACRYLWNWKDGKQV